MSWKVGDKVYMGHGDPESVGTIERITPSGQMYVDGKRFTSMGRRYGGGESLEPINESTTKRYHENLERLERIRQQEKYEQDVRHRLRSIDWRALSQEEIDRIYVGTFTPEQRRKEVISRATRANFSRFSETEAFLAVVEGK